MFIRPARDEEAAAVADLWTEAYCGRGPGLRTDPYTASDFEDSRRGGLVLVAVGAGARAGEPRTAARGTTTARKEAGLAGVAVLYPPGATGRAIAGCGEAELSRLAVAGEARRRGIGRALAWRCVELAREEGAAAVILWSRVHQVQAHRLYQSLGFRRLPERDDEDRGAPRLVFGLELRR